jgi:hypothetical protein
MAESRIQELWDDPQEDHAFDGHGLDRYEHAPVQWYRTTPAVLAIGAIAVAVIAILVSAVLLVSRQSQYPSSVTVEPSTSTTTPTTTQVPVTTASASPAPPPPAETVTAPSTNPAPVVLPPSAPPAPNKSPEFNVTRRPVTRTSMSVHPAPH